MHTPNEHNVNLGDDDGVDIDGIKYLSWYFTWNQYYVTYESKSCKFTRTLGLSFLWNHLLTMMQFLEICWLQCIIHYIVIETNQYATKLDQNGNTFDGTKWECFSISSLKALLRFYYI